MDHEDTSKPEETASVEGAARCSAFEDVVRFRVMLLRTTLRLTINEASAKSGTISRAVWGKVESGGREVTLSIMQKIADTLEASPEDLIGTREGFAACITRALLKPNN